MLIHAELYADSCVSESVNQTSDGLVEAAGSQCREMSCEYLLYPLHQQFKKYSGQSATHCLRIVVISLHIRQ